MAADAQPADAESVVQVNTRRDLSEQRNDLLDRLLDAEDQLLKRLHKLQAAEAQMLDAARTYDAFMSEQLFRMPTGTRSRAADLLELPNELRLLFARDHGFWNSGLGRFRAGA